MIAVLDEDVAEGLGQTFHSRGIGVTGNIALAVGQGAHIVQPDDVIVVQVRPQNRA